METIMNKPVVIYTTPTCPDCRTLKQWLQEQGIPFEERDLSNAAAAQEAKARTGVRVAPITFVGEAFFFGTFASQRPRIKAALGLADAH
jgi:glutaredoxin